MINWTFGQIAKIRHTYCINIASPEQMIPKQHHDSAVGQRFFAGHILCGEYHPRKSTRTLELVSEYLSIVLYVCTVEEERDPKGRSTVLITALGSWEKPVPLVEVVCYMTEHYLRADFLPAAGSAVPSFGWYCREWSRGSGCGCRVGRCVNAITRSPPRGWCPPEVTHPNK